MNTKKFYHISKAQVVGDFVPRIPENRLCEEDDKQARICVSTCVEGCLSAFPFSGDLNSDMKYSKQHDTLMLYYLYSIDQNSLPTKNILKPQQILMYHGVWDAEDTKEHWIINQNLSFPQEELIWIRHIETEKEFLQEGSIHKVTSLHFERSIEPFDRSYEFSFWEYDDYEKILPLIEEVSSQLETEEEYEYKYTVRFQVPAGNDLRTLWESYGPIRKQYARNYRVPRYFFNKK